MKTMGDTRIETTEKKRQKTYFNKNELQIKYSLNVHALSKCLLFALLFFYLRKYSYNKSNTCTRTIVILMFTFIYYVYIMVSCCDNGAEKQQYAQILFF